MQFFNNWVSQKLNSTNLKFANYSTIQLEGKDFPKISVRLSKTLHDKLVKLMEAFGVEGESESDRIRELIEKLYVTPFEKPTGVKPVSQSLETDTSLTCLRRFSHEGSFLTMTPLIVFFPH